MKNIIVLVSILISLISCNKNDKKLLPSSVGRYNELMVVINQNDWEGKIGTELKKVVADNVLGLPQPEPQFNVTHVSQQGFTGFLKYNRNVLSIEKGEKPELITEYNVYAKPQIFIRVKGPNKQEIAKVIKENKELIIQSFKNADIKQVQKDIAKKSHKTKLIKTFKEQGFSIKIPLDFSQVDDTGNFIWYRKQIQDYSYKINGSLNIIAYTLPLEVPFEQIKDSIVSIRNTIGEKHIPGAIDGSYLITEAAYTPHIFEDKLDGKRAYKVKGKWEVYNDFMAGPFVSYFVEDKTNNRIVVVEGFTYAPVVKKRDVMFMLEAIIRTLHIE